MSARFAITARLSELDAGQRSALLDRSFQAIDRSLEARVASLIARVRERGDSALVEIAREVGDAVPSAFEVEAHIVASAVDAIAPEIRRALQRVARNLERVQRDLLPPPAVSNPEPGISIRRRFVALDRVGVYAPGGRALYPSSVLMGVVPARVAGVREIVVTSPPRDDGSLDPLLLAAAAIGGAHRVFAVGGAQAIAALAYGTASIPRVDRIVGPGNAYVAEAKRQVARDCGIDSPAGPSEILIVADGTTDPEFVAAELIAQAEHDPDAVCVALALRTEIVTAIERAVERRFVGGIARRSIVESALASRGALLVVEDVEAAIAFCNAFAAEHLSLPITDAAAFAARIRNAGTIFLAGTSVAFGDYLTGANHVLPTAGFAKRGSGLSVLDFVRSITEQRTEARAALALADDTAILALAEGLPGHAIAARGARGDVTADTILDLATNTSLVGPPPSAEAILRSAAATPIERYPSEYGERLKRAIAARFGVSPQHVITGCGSDGVLQNAIATFATGGRLAQPIPTFSQIQRFASAARAHTIGVPLRLLGDVCEPDVSALLDSGADVVYVASPANPDGGLLSASARARLEQSRAPLTILDEAYAEFAGTSAAAFASTREGFLVTGTFSKAWGLAGLRIGFGIAGPRTIERIEATRGPFTVNRIAEEAALAALEEDFALVAARVAETIECREALFLRLRALGIAVLRSRANFLAVRVLDAERAATRLLRRGIRVRALPAQPVLGELVRIGLGPWSILEPYVPALLEVLEQETLREPAEVRP